MTGVLNASVGQIGGLRYNVTVAHDGGSPGTYGYNSSGPLGSISSAAFLGRTITVISSDQRVAQTDFTVGLNHTGSDLPTNFFQAVWVQCTDGSWRTYRTSDAFFSLNIWSWDTAAAKPWTAAATRSVILVP